MVLVRPSSRLTLSSFDQALSSVGVGCDLAKLTFVDVFGLVGCAVSLCQNVSSEQELLFVRPTRSPVAEYLSYMGFPEVLDKLGLQSNLPSSPSAHFPDVVLPVGSLQTMSLIDKGLKGNYLVGHSLMRRPIVEIV